MALLANCHRSKGRAYEPDDFHPMPHEESPEVDEASLDRALDEWLEGPRP